MKTKIITVALLLCFVISTNAQKKIEVTELPKPAQEFLKKYFSNTAVEKVKKDAEHGERGSATCIESTSKHWMSCYVKNRRVLIGHS